jgi:iron complex transport system substrate-binding protein
MLTGRIRGHKRSRIEPTSFGVRPAATGLTMPVFAGRLVSTVNAATIPTVHGGCTELEKMLRSLPAAAAMLLALCAVGIAQQRSPGELVLRDDAKRDVALDRRPQRIVTMLPSLTETVCALGACELLVATDRFSNWPARVNALPKVGGLDDAEVESLVNLQPDLILLSRSQRLTQRLGELGIRSFAIETQTYADIARTVNIIGEILGLSASANALNRRIEAEVDRLGAQQTARWRGRGPSVYFEVDQGPYAAGAESFIGELLARLGARNIVTGLGPFPKLNPEYVVRHDPDVIVAPPGDVSQLAQRPGWGAIRAVREQRICSFTQPVSDMLVRPGPRVAEGMRALADCLDRVAP